MSDDTRGNVGLHCRLNVESVAKYHADEQDTTKAPCNSTSDYESKKRGEGRGPLTRKDTTGGIAGGAKEAPKKGALTSVYCISSTRREERDVGRVNRGRHERTPRRASQGAQRKHRRRAHLRAA